MAKGKKPDKACPDCGKDKGKCNCVRKDYGSKKPSKK